MKGLKWSGVFTFFTFTKTSAVVGGVFATFIFTMETGLMGGIFTILRLGVKG